MRRETVRARGAAICMLERGGDSTRDAPLLLWAHGWGHTHRNLLALSEAAPLTAHSILLDLPGFGDSPPPPGPWGTEDYADAVAEWLADRPAERRVWIGHSFGARVGLQLAARHPKLVNGLLLIAAAGLPRRRSPAERARLAARRWAFRLARHLAPEGPARDRLRARFGSADYARAGPLRPILLKAVNEDLTDVARRVLCPTVLVYGDHDTETPPEIGTRLGSLIPNSRLLVLRGFDHWNVLTEGRHQIVQRLSELVEQIA